MMDYKIIVSRQFDSKHLKVKYQPIKLRRKKTTQDFIINNWKKIKTRNPSIFAGVLVSVKQYILSEKCLTIETLRTTYDDFLASKDTDFFKRFPSEKPANPLSVGTVLITQDNKLVLGIRSQNVAIEKNSLSVPAGMIDDNDIKNKSVDCFNAIKREIVEEVQIPKSSITQPCCMGLVWNEKGKQTYIPFFCRTRKKSSDIIKKFQSGEFIDLKFISNNKAEVKRILKSNLADIAKPTLEIYLDLFSKLNK